MNKTTANETTFNSSLDYIDYYKSTGEYIANAFQNPEKGDKVQLSGTDGFVLIQKEIKKFKVNSNGNAFFVFFPEAVSTYSNCFFFLNDESVGNSPHTHLNLDEESFKKAKWNTDSNLMLSDADFIQVRNGPCSLSFRSLNGKVGTGYLKANKLVKCGSGDYKGSVYTGLRELIAKYSVDLENILETEEGVKVGLTNKAIYIPGGLIDLEYRAIDAIKSVQRVIIGAFKGLKADSIVEITINRQLELIPSIANYEKFQPNKRKYKPSQIDINKALEKLND